MSQKGTREKNDISIIIGSLPLRLQRKIAEGVGDTNTTQHHGNAADDETATSKMETVLQDSPAEVDGSDVPSIDFFLKMGAKTSEPGVVGIVPPNEVLLNGVCQQPATTASKEHADDATSIPGLLRVSAAHVAKTTTSSREKHRRQGRPQREEILLPTSPAHQPLKVTSQPAWFGAADATHAEGLQQLHGQYLHMLQQNTVLLHWQDLWLLHEKLQHIFTQLLLHHLKFCCEQKVDTFFWKLLFYNTREHLKAQRSAEAAKYILALLTSGLEFYTNLYAQVCGKYLNADKEESLQPHDNENCERNAHKFASIAKVAAQKLLICLGDLCRYRSKQLLSANNYSDAAKYYQQAQRLIPTNGIPYNQLAIIAILNRKQFDAIYFHMRSLVSSNAICSAKESLLVLFDAIRKKYEETEMKASPVHNVADGSKSLRKEVWIYPDGVRRLHCSNVNATKATLREENRLDEMSTDELLRRFIALYLYILGKLYTSIGMETVPDLQRKLFAQFNALLKRELVVLSGSKLLKLLALNIFVLQENTHRDDRRETCYQAFNFCNQFFGLVLRKCNQLFVLVSTAAAATDTQNFADLNKLLQYAKSYVDFLAHNLDIWEPLRSDEHTVIDCWAELQQLLQHIASIGERKSLSPIVLEEDIFFQGFTPFAVISAVASGSRKCKCQLEPSPEHEQFCERLNRIAAFEACYKANSKRLAAPEESFVLEQLSKTFQSALEHLQSDAENSENIVVNGNADQSGVPSMLQAALDSNADNDNAQLTQLSKLKLELAAKSNVKKMYNAKLEELLSYVDTKVYIEVRPKYLLPDTNCFIDCLEDFEMLASELKRYTLVIPLTVVKELDGLSKGVKLESYEKSQQKQRIHHFDDVSSRAKKSLDYIKASKYNVKCATTKGSIINASLFALVEEEYVSNDDKILATAVALSKTLSKETSKDGKCLIQTELVLITTDRNLRVKALSRNLAVSELREFLQWAKHC